MKGMRIVGLAMSAALLTGPAPVPAASSAVHRDVGVASADRTMSTLHVRCRSSRWCTPSYWAWELLLASHTGDRLLAQRITVRLLRLQRPNGRWGLGFAWGRASMDFKRRTPADAESWEVAEVGLALLYAWRRSRIPAAREPAFAAARYLSRRIVHFRGGSYLAHMPDCNRWLQPQSTLAAAALLSRFPRFRRQALALRRSGVAMGWRRIIPRHSRTSLRHARWGPSINDYERIQVGFYLSLMGDPRGARILRAQSREPLDSSRAAPYLVVVHAVLGQDALADRLASTLLGFRPQYGYDLALRDWIHTMAAEGAARRSRVASTAAPDAQPDAQPETQPTPQLTPQPTPSQPGGFP